jgi:hypothetical protein
MQVGLNEVIADDQTRLRRLNPGEVSFPYNPPHLELTD